MKIIFEKRVRPVSKKYIQIVAVLHAEGILTLNKAEIKENSLSIQEYSRLFPISPLKNGKSAFSVISKKDCFSNICPLNDGNHLFFSVSTKSNKLDFEIEVSSGKIKDISGNIEFGSILSEIPDEISEDKLNIRKKIASETYFSDEGFSSDFMDAAMDNGIDMDKAQDIFQSGESLALKIALDSVLLNDDDYLIYMNEMMIKVRTKIMSEVSF